MELVDLYDENRIPLGRTAQRFSKREKGTWRLIAHLCIFDSRGRLLLQQRSADKRVWPGKWDVSAAGGVCAGETTRLAAVRELFEELGVSARPEDLRSVCTVTFNHAFDDYFILKRDVDLRKLRLQEEEVSAVRWATRQQVLDLIRRDGFVPYSENFLAYLFDMARNMDFQNK
ncbi:MAG: NUDIX domain-containing protein [Oscillibacter sp.]|nr:NUDIX domain-containing protein [Oscillibacter sp.]